MESKIENTVIINRQVSIKWNGFEITLANTVSTTEGELTAIPGQLITANSHSTTI